MNCFEYPCQVHGGDACTLHFFWYIQLTKSISVLEIVSFRVSFADLEKVVNKCPYCMQLSESYLLF